jgi:hypothetical protein
MTLTSAKNLLILNDAYKKHSIEEHRLLSPPLTPIEAQPSNPIWNYARKNKRKEFIKSYARMAPYLKPVSSRKLLASGHERVFSLNVYRDVAIEKKKNDDDIRHSIMLNKTVVSLSPKRKPMSEKPTDIKKRKRVGSVLPTGKDAAMAFDAIDIDSSDESFFPEGWLPCPDGLDTVPVKVSWKGTKKKKLVFFFLVFQNSKHISLFRCTITS